MAGTEGPVVFCLHGGGYSGYVWFLLYKHLNFITPMIYNMMISKLTHLTFLSLIGNGFTPKAHFMLVQLYYVNMVFYFYYSNIDMKQSCYGLTIFICFPKQVWGNLCNKNHGSDATHWLTWSSKNEMDCHICISARNVYTHSVGASLAPKRKRE